jgi:hypothetical protein
VSESIAISKAVAAKLNSAVAAGTLGGLQFIAVHSLMPDFTNEDFASLVVTVRPRGDLRSFASRTRTQHDYPIEICVRKHVGKVDSLVAEEMVAVAEKIADHWRFLGPGYALPGRNERMADEVTVEFDDETIRTHRIVKNVITVTFRGLRS